MSDASEEIEEFLVETDSDVYKIINKDGTWIAIENNGKGKGHLLVGFGTDHHEGIKNIREVINDIKDVDLTAMPEDISTDLNKKKKPISYNGKNFLMVLIKKTGFFGFFVGQAYRFEQMKTAMLAPKTK